MQELTIDNTRFGSITIPHDSVVTFASGLIGFSELERFALVQAHESVVWLQSIDAPELALPLVPAQQLSGDYAATACDHATESRALSEPSDETTAFVVLTALSGRRPTVNMMAPIVIDPATRRGCQLLLDGSDHPYEMPLAPTSFESPAVQHAAEGG